MILTQDNYIRNHLFFTEEERETLTNASQIATAIYNENASQPSIDEYLSDLCYAIIHSITKILKDYKNEYPQNKE